MVVLLLSGIFVGIDLIFSTISFPMSVNAVMFGLSYFLLLGDLIVALAMFF